MLPSSSVLKGLCSGIGLGTWENYKENVMELKERSKGVNLVQGNGNKFTINDTHRGHTVLFSQVRGEIVKKSCQVSFPVTHCAFQEAVKSSVKRAKSTCELRSGNTIMVLFLKC
jgi:hypothetical protein